MDKLDRMRIIWIGLIILLLTLFGCRGQTRQYDDFPQVIHSADNQLVLVIDLNQSKSDPTKYLCLKFTIQDTNGNVLYQEQTGASVMTRWEMAWDKDNRVWLNSADIGTYYWEQQAEGMWKKFVFAKVDDPPSPPAPVATELEK